MYRFLGTNIPYISSNDYLFFRLFGAWVRTLPARDFILLTPTLLPCSTFEASRASFFDVLPLFIDKIVSLILKLLYFLKIFVRQIQNKDAGQDT